MNNNTRQDLWKLLEKLYPIPRDDAYANKLGLINKDLKKRVVSIPYEKVTVFDRDENERRYISLLNAFAHLLKSFHTKSEYWIQL